MRSVDRELKERRKGNPEKCRKPDTTKNADDLDKAISKCLGKENRKYLLRINKTTVIYVTKDKCNEEYRQKYIGRINGGNVNYHAKAERIDITKEEIQNAIADGMPQTKIAKMFGVSVTTLRNKMKEYGLFNYTSKVITDTLQEHKL